MNEKLIREILGNQSEKCLCGVLTSCKQHPDGTIGALLHTAQRKINTPDIARGYISAALQRLEGLAKGTDAPFYQPEHNDSLHD